MISGKLTKIHGNLKKIQGFAKVEGGEKRRVKPVE